MCTRTRARWRVLVFRVLVHVAHVCVPVLVHVCVRALVDALHLLPLMHSTCSVCMLCCGVHVGNGVLNAVLNAVLTECGTECTVGSCCVHAVLRC
jgi:hypothetical protein